MSHDYITIQLTKGYETFISIEDSDLTNLNWYANSQNGLYYATRMIPGKPRKREQIHRIILERMLDRTLEKGEFPDHIDGNSLNNQRGNIRLSSCSQNQHNAKRRSDNTSGYKGVSKYRDGRWKAAIMMKGKIKHLGYFDSAELAHEAYKQAAKEHFGEYARFE